MSLSDRINKHVASFKVGDKVTISLEPEYEKDINEHDGTIVSITGDSAQVETKWGTFKEFLTLLSHKKETT